MLLSILFSYSRFFIAMFTLYWVFNFFDFEHYVSERYVFADLEVFESLYCNDFYEILKIISKFDSLIEFMRYTPVFDNVRIFIIRCCFLFCGHISVILMVFCCGFFSCQMLVRSFRVSLISVKGSIKSVLIITRYTGYTLIFLLFQQFSLFVYSTVILFYIHIFLCGFKFSFGQLLG